MERLVYISTNKIQQVVSKLLYKCQTLAALVIESNGEVKNFEKIANTIIDTPVIRNVLLAPNGVVAYVYPKEGNEGVIGLDFFAPGPGNREAVLAAQKKEIVLGGPFELRQGGQALVGRIPVYLDKETAKNFWGLVSVTLRYPDALLEAELEMLKDQHYAYEIWRLNPDTGEKQIISHSNYEYDNNTPHVEVPFSFFNAEWNFRIYPVRQWYEYREVWLIIGVSLIVSFLLAFLVKHNNDLSSIKHKLIELSEHDELTGIYNRRGLFIKLESLIRDSEPFILAYMDLDGFKSINDMRGHAVGDRVLTNFARYAQLNLRKFFYTKKYTIARIGGDEFVILFHDTTDMTKVNTFFSKLKNDLLDIQPIDDMDIPVKFSAGLVAFPKDGQTADTLLLHADTAMYKNKIHKRNVRNAKREL